MDDSESSRIDDEGDAQQELDAPPTTYRTAQGPLGGVFAVDEDQPASPVPGYGLATSAQIIRTTCPARPTPRPSSPSPRNTRQPQARPGPSKLTPGVRPGP